MEDHGLLEQILKYYLIGRQQLGYPLMQHRESLRDET